MPKPAPSRRARGPMRFQATLERLPSRLNWTVIYVPFDAGKLFGVLGQIKIKGQINGFPFRSCLFPRTQGGHILLVNKRMQRAAKVRPGAIANFEIEPDTEKRVYATPHALHRILSEDKPFRRWYAQLTQSTRHEIAKWVNDPQSEAAQTRRAEQIAERLLAVMEAERELPPILQLAFARNPRARDGWEQMSAAKRRAHLLGIYYYRNPEGRAGRIQKMLEDAEKILECKGLAGKNRRMP